MKGITKADKTEKVGITLPISLLKQTECAATSLGARTFARPLRFIYKANKERLNNDQLKDRAFSTDRYEKEYLI